MPNTKRLSCSGNWRAWTSSSANAVVCRNFAESQGWEIVKEFSEKGVSGFKKSAKERDELQKIQQAAMEGKFDILLVFMFDRLGRRDDETPFIVEWFTKQGIEVWSVNEGQQRFDTHVDKLMNYIRYWQASATSCLHGRMCTTLPTTMNAVPSCSNSSRRFVSEKTTKSRSP